MADTIEELVQKIRDLGDVPKIIVTLATVFGLLFVLIYGLRILYSLFNGKLNTMETMLSI